MMEEGVMVCTICGCEAEFIEIENVWRHKGDPFDSKYFAQSFCDKYGYPIQVESEASRAARASNA